MARLTRNCMLVFALLVATAAVGFARDHEREGRHHSHYRVGIVYYSGPVHYYSVPRYYDRYCYEDRDYCEECYEDYVRYVPRGRVHVDIVVNAYGHHDHYYRHRHHHDDDDDD